MQSPSYANGEHARTWQSGRSTKLTWDALELIVSFSLFVASDGLAFNFLLAAGVAGTGVFYDLFADDEMLASEARLEKLTNPKSAIGGIVGSLIPSIGFDAGAGIGTVVDKGQNVLKPSGGGKHERFIRDWDMTQFGRSAKEAKEKLFDKPDEDSRTDKSKSDPNPAPQTPENPAPSKLPPPPPATIRRMGGGAPGTGPRGGGPVYAGGGGHNPSDRPEHGPLGTPGGGSVQA